MYKVSANEIRSRQSEVQWFSEALQLPAPLCRMRKRNGRDSQLATRQMHHRDALWWQSEWGVPYTLAKLLTEMRVAGLLQLYFSIFYTIKRRALLNTHTHTWSPVSSRTNLKGRYVGKSSASIKKLPEWNFTVFRRGATRDIDMMNYTSIKTGPYIRA